MDKDKTYPIGTKIKYVGYCRNCDGKIGEVVKKYESSCRIALPQSTCSAVTNGGGTIVCSWSDIVPVITKNQQLLFAFMEQEDEI